MMIVSHLYCQLELWSAAYEYEINACHPVKLVWSFSTPKACMYAVRTCLTLQLRTICTIDPPCPISNSLIRVPTYANTNMEAFV